MENKKTDYIKVTSKTRPICGNYELSAIITKFAKEVYDQKNLDGFAEDRKFNSIINPTDVALQLLMNNTYGAFVSRDDEILELKNMYVNYNNIELLENYFERQRKIIKRCIIDRLEEASSKFDVDEENSEEEDIELENVLQFDDGPAVFEEEIEFDESDEQEYDED